MSLSLSAIGQLQGWSKAHQGGCGILWWLNHYRFGPAEWLWRSLTYGKRQPMTLEA